MEKKTLGSRLQELLTWRPLQTFISHYQSAEMDLSSVAVAYYLMLTAFPLLVIVANLVPYLPINVSDILEMMETNLPPQLYQMTQGVVRTIFAKPAQGILGIATITGLWTMTKSLTSLQKAVNKVYQASPHRDFVISYAIGILTSLLILFLLTFALMLTTFSEAILQVINRRYPLGDMADLALKLTQPLLGLIIFIGIGVLYFILPNVKIKKIRYILPGTVLTSFVIIFLNNLLGAYVAKQLERLGDLRVFGSVVALVIMAWFIVLARILITGAVFNATLQNLSQGNLESRRGDVKALLQGVGEEPSTNHATSSKEASGDNH
ncbi:YihY/virulence factor BrkB family protein [Streptococcus cuniculipharyngis]|uniref:YihY/virulence factor BrkB family protein n=1 Tax=Streptococcus cuniculipharyngis TaxID=1562651 RepID=A0A5C5SDB8_9STRE|nr:YihY/virulence factor BrkB family protein [Streptococcus cuniculipharyngis]TWS99087.1 YihY/virulence factor BrkB family protein [Streptococcus cuniculipharyngis]